MNQDLNIKTANAVFWVNSPHVRSLIPNRSEISVPSYKTKLNFL